jgi:hypothetical protein
MYNRFRDEHYDANVTEHTTEMPVPLLGRSIERPYGKTNSRRFP